MALRFVLCVALERAYFPPGHIDRQLLQQANRWLARRLQGYDDRLLVVGRHFTTDQELLEVLVPYGLESAERRLADPDEENDGDSISATVSSWLQSAHSSAVPALLAGTAAGSGGYGTEGWWWTGIEAADDSSEAVADILLATTSPTFKRQAATWAAILEEDYDSDSGDEYAEHELRLLALTLARWLTGFDAACENTFFDFDYADGASAAELSGLRLGYEAGRLLSSDPDDTSEATLLALATRACLEERTGTIHSVLSDAFGGNAQLFWSLYLSIWPRLNESVEDSFESLVGLRQADYSELERPWRFVSEGWIDLSEE